MEERQHSCSLLPGIPTVASALRRCAESRYLGPSDISACRLVLMSGNFLFAVAVRQEPQQAPTLHTMKG